MSTTNILDLNNRIDKIEKAGIGTAAETSYSNTTSGLTATNVQSAIDELDGVTDNMASSITDIEGDILAIEGDVEDLEKEKVDWTSEGILGAKNLLKKSSLYVIMPFTLHGLTFTPQDDNSILITGTADQDYLLTLYDRLQNTNFLSEGDYTFSCCPTGGSESTYSAFLGLYGASWDLQVTDMGTPTDFTITSAMENDGIVINISIKNGFAFPDEGLLFKPQIILQSTTDNNYVPSAFTNKELTDIVQCVTRTAGTYTLKATVVSGGDVTYEWVLDT